MGDGNKGGEILRKANIIVIADDLTGANDTGVQFTEVGLSTRVMFSNQGLNTEQMTDDVIVVDTDSRADDPQEAYCKVYNIAKIIRESDRNLLFKKVDSTLRGNLGYEIDAILDIYPEKVAFIAPAFPKIGRTTVQGIHYINGCQLSETELANDLKTPVTNSYIPSVLQAQTNKKVGLIKLKDIRQGTSFVLEKLNRLISQKTKIIVFDAESDDDLKTIVNTGMKLEHMPLWVGSAGLATYLSQCLSPRVPKEKSNSERNKQLIPALIISGTMNSITQKQIQCLVETDKAIEYVLPTFSLIQDSRKELEQYIQGVLDSLSKNNDVIIRTDVSEKTREEIQKYMSEEQLSFVTIGQRIADALGYISKKIVDQAKVRGLILTGGDTAASVCHYLNGEGLLIENEVEPGIPLTRLIGGSSKGLSVITKAGAFGSKQALVKAIKHLL